MSTSHGAESSGDYFTDPDVEKGLESSLEKQLEVNNTRKGVFRNKWSKTGNGTNKNLSDDSAGDVTVLYLCGFVIGWFTWLFGLTLGFFAGPGSQAVALRKGLRVGALAVTLPFALIVGLAILLLNRWNAFLDKFSIFR